MVILIMGVQGTGKTTVGQLVAARLGWKFLDADDFHPYANKAKMAYGLSLTDEDRAPWLRILRSTLVQHEAGGLNAVLACSALRERYRHVLRVPSLRLVHLVGSFDVINARVRARQGHFASPALLPSQFATLEPPVPEERALTIDVDSTPPTEVRDRIVAQLA